MKSDIEQQRNHFNAIAERYFSARSHENHLLLKQLIWKKFFERNVSVTKNIHSVLEPMCGVAEGYEILQDNLPNDFGYLGFDYSEEMVKIAKDTKPEITVEWGDVTTFKSTAEPVDMVILIGGLHHVYSQTADVIENLSQAMSSSGLFLSFEPTHNNWLSKYIRNRIYRSNDLFDDDTEQGYEYQELQANFSNVGYEKVDEVYPGLLAYILYYNPDAFPFLNRGSLSLVRIIFCLDRLFWSNWLGRKMSFATLSLWRLRKKA